LSKGIIVIYSKTMSISSFNKPSDDEVLKKMLENDLTVTFVGNGTVYQNIEETLYFRTIKIKIKKEEVFQNVIYEKKGTSWNFKCTEKVKKELLKE
jgi:hypothetical protein